MAPSPPPRMEMGPMPPSPTASSLTVANPGPEPTPLLQVPTNRLVWIDCPFCTCRAVTTIKREESEAQDRAASWCFYFTLGTCAWVPGACGWFENTVISCSVCNHKVATVLQRGSRQVHGPSEDGRVTTREFRNGKEITEVQEPETEVTYNA